jgi:hypothetical protein
MKCVLDTLIFDIPLKFCMLLSPQSLFNLQCDPFLYEKGYTPQPIEHARHEKKFQNTKLGRFI